MKHFTILTLFPDMFPGPLGQSITGHALGHLWTYEAINLRDFAGNKHNRVDDEPFGGGAGMVIRAEVVMAALEHVEKKSQQPQPGKLVHLTPRGKLLTPSIAKTLAREENITLICGRYESIDQRLFDYYNQQHRDQPIIELSIGDYVLSGGEIPAMVLIDTVLRFVPGVLGKEESHAEESHEHGWLEHHHYTRPAEWRGHKVPEILLTGDHKKIKEFREEEAKTITQNFRPDLLQNIIKK